MNKNDRKTAEMLIQNRRHIIELLSALDGDESF